MRAHHDCGGEPGWSRWLQMLPSLSGHFPLFQNPKQDLDPVPHLRFLIQKHNF